MSSPVPARKLEIRRARLYAWAALGGFAERYGGGIGQALCGGPLPDHESGGSGRERLRLTCRQRDSEAAGAWQPTHAVVCATLVT